MEIQRSFASDNNAGVHPEVMAAIVAANQGHVVAYGDDPFTKQAIETFQKHFGSDIFVHFVFNGTGANVLCLGAMAETFDAVICAETSHIYNDECGAPERWTGCKLIPVKTPDGKLAPELLKPYCRGWGDQHHVQPRVISLTQSTELGTVYNIDEIKRLTDFAHGQRMFVHVDGARLANAAAHLGVGLREITSACNIDALSFGGTKNGLLGGEAVIFFSKELNENFLYRRKQSMQLASKMRFIAVQFDALLKNDLWLRNARHSNKMAQLLAHELSSVTQLQIVQKVQANGVFAKVPPSLIPQLQKRTFFYVWNEDRSEVRWMTSFDTQEDDIHRFVADIKSLTRGL